jgi:hypothetical protein
MWIDKLAYGVVRIVTPIGPRYIELTFLQRVFFLWVFRHFDKLPQQVLSPREQRLIDALCADQGFLAQSARVHGAPILGTVERLPVVRVEEMSPRRPTTNPADASAVSQLVADVRHRS